MNTYEAVFIIKPELDKEALDREVNSLKGLITKEKGEVASVEAWGKRRLAYAITRAKEGHYFLFNFKLSPGAIKTLKSAFKLNDNILREMIIKRDA